MNAKTVNETDFKNEKLIEFFTKTIDHKDMALVIRRLNYTISITAIRNDEYKNPIDKDYLESGFFWLNELAEILNPYLNLQ